jgi:hypothetical protein
VGSQFVIEDVLEAPPGFEPPAPAPPPPCVPVLVDTDEVELELEAFPAPSAHCFTYAQS